MPCTASNEQSRVRKYCPYIYNAKFSPPTVTRKRRRATNIFALLEKGGGDRDALTNLGKKQK
jgi:hypothetical protein